MADQQFVMTKKNYDALVAELDNLVKVKRPEIIERIAEARSHGDLSENAEYEIAREEQAQLQNEIDAIKEKLANAKILDEKSINDDAVSIGCAVEVLEADIADGLAAVENCGLTRTDIIEGFLTKMSVNDMRANRYNRGILGELTEEDYALAGSEMLASKRYKKDDLVDKGFTDAELAGKVKPRGKVDKSKCGGLKTYTIVGSHEADALNGKISNESRVGAALLDKEENDVVMVGDLLFKIVGIVVDKKAVKR